MWKVLDLVLSWQQLTTNHDSPWALGALSACLPVWWSLYFMKILVTGAAGFIGMHLCKALLELNHEVVGIDNLSSITYDQSLKLNRLRHLGLEIDEHFIKGPIQAGKLTFYRMDLCDRAQIRELIVSGNFDFVVNLAALAGVRLSTAIPEQYLQSNVNGFFNILDALKELYSQEQVKHPRLVFASSSSVYGECDQAPFREDNTNVNQVSVYAATKKMDETLAYAYASLFKIDTIGLRFFTVYGPYGRPDMAPFIFTKRILAGQELHIFNEGKQRRDYTYVDDIIAGIVAILSSQSINTDKSVPFDVFNIGNGDPVELFDFVKAIEKVTGIEAKLILEPKQQGDVDQTYADVSKLKQYFNFRPNTKLETGLAAFYKWFKNYYS